MWSPPPQVHVCVVLNIKSEGGGGGDNGEGGGGGVEGGCGGVDGGCGGSDGGEGGGCRRALHKSPN